MNTIKRCAFGACRDRLADNGIYPVWVEDMVALFGNWTVDPFYISVKSKRTGTSSARQ